MFNFVDMKKTIVVFYSRKGSNKYLANKTAKELNCDIIEIKPKLNAHLLMLMGLNFGNRKLKANLSEYDQIVLFGPIWMGKLIVPLKNFVSKNKGNIKKLVFATCCGSSFENKDKKFGHGFVFKEIRNMLGEKCTHCEAFPITLVVPDEFKEKGEVVMKTRLSDRNFKGKVLDVFNDFKAQLVQ